MMQSTESRERNHQPSTRGAGSFLWSFFVQPEMRSVFVVVADVRRKQSFQVLLIDRNDVVQQIAATAFNPSFRDSVLPRTFKRGSDRGEAHRADRDRSFQTIFPVAVEDQESLRGLKRERFSQLLNDPSARGILGDIEVQNPPTIMADHEQAVEDAERDGGNREEIHRGDGFAMIPQEGQPALGGARISGRPPHPSRNGSLRDIESEEHEFTVDTRCAPGRILRDHAEDQIADFLRDVLSADRAAESGDRSPIEFESGAVPADNGVGAHKDEGLLPARPESTRQYPEQLVSRGQSGPRMLAFEHGELLAEDEVFKEQALT